MQRLDILSERRLEQECQFSASRSSGSGGQNVNKVNTKVELRFNVSESMLLTDDEKAIIVQKLQHRITQEGELIIVCQQERSQLKNKNACISRFYVLLAQALKPKKPRLATKASRASVRKRLERKKIQSVKKVLRRPPEQ